VGDVFNEICFYLKSIKVFFLLFILKYVFVFIEDPFKELIDFYFLISKIKSNLVRKYSYFYL